MFSLSNLSILILDSSSFIEFPFNVAKLSICRRGGIENNSKICNDCQLNLRSRKDLRFSKFLRNWLIPSIGFMASFLQDQFCFNPIQLVFQPIFKLNFFVIRKFSQ